MLQLTANHLFLKIINNLAVNRLSSIKIHEYITCLVH
jgi:hypothetical protein